MRERWSKMKLPYGGAVEGLGAASSPLLHKLGPGEPLEAVQVDVVARGRPSIKQLDPRALEPEDALEPQIGHNIGLHAPISMRYDGTPSRTRPTARVGVGVALRNARNNGPK